ncbi:hypothetical protein EZV62_008256 [Acer yangbiense]|uniref:Uncharacterized protein n=1 Tax=Acer yangbiense TaxID=1000413 RepID=A0A5C7ICW0_9ROSI|nr:hypothetical protein EZV62_008256 [Acer yangbiense]
MFRSRVIGSILKRNKAQSNNISSNLKEIASRRVISSSSSSSSSSTVARSSLYGFRSLFKNDIKQSWLCLDAILGQNELLRYHLANSLSYFKYFAFLGIFEGNLFICLGMFSKW